MTKNPEAYVEAQRIAVAEPGTVCTTVGHYTGSVPRHAEPYRTGYCHHYRQPDEHWHAHEEELNACRDALGEDPYGDRDKRERRRTALSGRTTDQTDA